MRAWLELCAEAHLFDRLWGEPILRVRVEFTTSLFRRWRLSSTLVEPAPLMVGSTS